MRTSLRLAQPALIVVTLLTACVPSQNVESSRPQRPISLVEAVTYAMMHDTLDSPSIAIVLDTQSVRKIAATNPLAVAELRSNLPERVHLGVPSSEVICGSVPQRRCIVAYFYSFESKADSAVLTVGWGGHRNSCGSSQSGAYVLRRMGSTVTVRVRDKIYGDCSPPIPDSN